MSSNVLSTVTSESGRTGRKHTKGNLSTRVFPRPSDKTIVDPETFGPGAKQEIPQVIARIFGGPMVTVNYCMESLAFRYRWKYKGERLELLAGESTKRESFVNSLLKFKRFCDDPTLPNETPEEPKMILPNESYVPMLTNSDCGVTLLGNLLGPILKRPCREVRDELALRYGFPNTGGWSDDFWDNPARHEVIIRDYLLDRGLSLRVLDSAEPRRNVGILGYYSSKPWLWHWVAALEPIDTGEWVFHDGKKLVKYPTCQWNPENFTEVLRYAIDAPIVGKNLGFQWYLWKWLMKIFVA